jgi:hypothetical protein
MHRIIQKGNREKGVVKNLKDKVVIEERTYTYFKYTELS